jgi:hypothetical protein
MIRTLQRCFVAFAVIMLGVVGASVAQSQPVSAASAKCQSDFLGFPAWYDGLLNSDCEIRKPQSDNNGGGIGTFIWRIVLNIIEIALRLVAWLSAGFIIYGGFRYLTSSGTPDRTAAAKKTIQNAVVGLIISFMSVLVVTLVAGGIK